MSNTELAELAKVEQEMENVMRRLANNAGFFDFVEGATPNITKENVEIFLAATLAVSMNLPNTEESRAFTMAAVKGIDCGRLAQMTRDYIEDREIEGLSLTVGEMG